MIKVIIADDHVIFRQGLLKLLQSATDISVIGEAGEGQESLSLIKKETPDVAVLDISMPGLSGIEIVKEIERLGLTTNVIFLTMHNDPLTVKKAMQSNALGYVLKDDAFEDLLYAIRTVALGKTFISPSISQKILKSEKPKETDKRILTEREQEVLRFIALGLTNKKIAEKLFISVKTVDTHRTRILQKLDAHTAADLVRYAIKIGLIESQ
jgi:DNA-binding NarL/FixJ family response regulator